jgi:hypothetical protein
MFEPGEDIISVALLALICIVIAAIIIKISPVELYMPTFAVVAVCLWVAYDYMLLRRYKAKQACLEKDKEIAEANEELMELAKGLSDTESETDADDKPAEPAKPEQQHKNEFDIALANDVPFEELYKYTGCSADTRIANRMKYMGLQPKLAADIRARHNRYTLQPYFDEELRANEARDWWDNENDYLDAFM